MNLKSCLILISLLSFMLAGFTQQSKPYINYSEDGSKVGLTDYKSQIVPIIYDQIYRTKLLAPTREEQYKLSTIYYFAKKNGKYGVISGYNDQVIPCEYDSLIVGNQSYIQYRLNEKWGLIDRNNNRLIDPIYDGYRIENDSVIFYRAQELWGLMNMNFDITTPPRFKKIEEVESQWYEEGQSQIHSDHLFYVTEKDKRGIYDMDRDIIIPEKNGHYLFIHFHNKRHPSSDANYIFQDTTNYLRQVYNSNGKHVFSEEIDTDLQFYETRLLSRGHSLQEYENAPITTEFLTVCQQDRSQTIYNLHTGKHSKIYREVEFLFDKIIANDCDDWVLLDENFKEIYRTEKYFLARDAGFYWGPWPGPTTFYFSTADSYQSSFPEWDLPFVYIFETKRMTEPTPTVPDTTYYCQAGLVNYETGKMIPPNYDQINWIRSGDTLLFYATHHVYNKEANKDYLTRMDIFNADFKKIKSVKLKAFVFGEDVLSSKSLNGAIFIQKKNGKVGGIDPYGRTILDYEYDTLKLLENRGWPSKTKLTYLTIQKGEKKGLLDMQGNLLLPIEFDHFSLLNNGNVSAQHGELYDLFDENIKLRIANCSHIKNHPNYIIHDGFLKLVDSINIISIDSTTIDFTQQTSIVSSNFLIDKTGKVIYQTQYRIREDESGYFITLNRRLRHNISKAGEVTIIVTPE